MITIPSQKLIDFVAGIFEHAGSSEAEAKRIGTYLVTANLTGHDSHGVYPRAGYMRWKNNGDIVPDRTVKLLVDTPSLAVIDGCFGYGQTVGPQAVAIGIEKCKSAGLAAITLRNSGHIGRIGDWAEMAAAEVLSQFILSTRQVLFWLRRLVAWTGGFPLRRIASASRVQANRRLCLILLRRWLPKARFWLRAGVARNCRRAH